MDADDPTFDQAMRGVVRLAGRGVVRERRRAAAKATAKPRRETAPAFHLERWGEQVEAVARGADRGLLSALNRGEWPPERELDLHGQTERSAERLVAATVAGALERGQRCLLVIHGRGLRSEAEPTLKEALIRWLSQPPLAPSVLVFTTAPAHRGGPGATLVLLRKRRSA